MLKSIGSTWFLNLLQMAVMLVLSPFILHKVGTEQNGLWVTIVSFTGILGLLIVGVPMASVRFVAEQVAKKDLKAINAAISTCLGITTFLGLFALLVGGMLWFVFNANYLSNPATSALGVSAISDAQIAFAMVVMQVAFAFSMRLPYGIFDAHNDFIAKNVVMAGELTLRLILTVVFLLWNNSLSSLALVQILCMMTEFVVAITVLKRRHQGVIFSYTGFDKSQIGRILSFSVYAMLLNVGLLIAFRIDALVIGAHLGPKDVIWFDFGNKFFDPLSGIVVAVGAVMMPMATRLNAGGNLIELRGLFLKWSKICFSIVLAIGIYLMAAGPAFLGWWAGPEFEGPSGEVLRVLLPSFLIYLPVRGVAIAVLMGLGKVRVPAYGMVIMGISNLIISISLVDSMGIIGVAIGTAIPNVIFAIVIINVVCMELGLTIRQYFSYVFYKAFFAAFVPLAVIYGFIQIYPLKSFFALTASGLLMMAVFFVVWMVYVYRNDAYVDLVSPFKKMLLKLK